MPEQPYSRPETFEFDNAHLKVLCLVSQECVKGLQWALDRIQFSDRKFKLFLGNLHNISDHQSVDLVILSLDLGQPVPLESLKKIPRKAGLCLFTQPTPSQLLQLGELPYWQPMAWDGASYDKLAIRLCEVAERFDSDIIQRQFIENIRKFILRDQKSIDYIEWINPPENYTGMLRFHMDPLRGTITVGASRSHCDIKLPLSQNESSEIGEFRFINGKWSFKSIRDSSPINIRGHRENLKQGDQIEIERHLLHLKHAQKIDDLMKIAKRLHIIEESDLLPEAGEQAAPKTVAELCRDLLVAGITGELRLSAGTKNGLVYFNDGVIYHSVTGSICGVKALTRIFSWEKPSWKFNPQKSSTPDRTHFRVSLKEFDALYDNWKSAWVKISPFIPPISMKIRCIPTQFLTRNSFTVKEVRVLAALCEYPLVRDVMNACGEMWDIEIAQHLVNFRRLGLIEPAKG